MLFIDYLMFLTAVFAANVCLKAYSVDFIVMLSFLFAFSGIYVLFLKGFYNIRKYKFFIKDSYLLLEGILICSIVPFLVLVILSSGKVPFKFMFLMIAIACFSVLSWRIAFYFYIKYLKKEKNILIIGTDKLANAISREILSRPELNLKIAGFVDNDENKINTELKDIIAKNNIKFVAVSKTATKQGQSVKEIARHANKVKTYKGSCIYEKITQKVPVDMIDSEWFKSNFNKIDNVLYNFLKRTFDICAALVILGVTLPFLLVICILIKAYDNGPIFYVQDRVGKNGKIFRLYKLRTMVQNADKAGMVNEGNTKDTRVIPICKFVRKARFDEIPQMINILKGDMSIVGPRAEFVDFVRKYEKEIPFYNYRHFTIPGWTGWAQINQGHCVTIADVTEKLRYDLYYIKNRNIFWDFSILLKAVFMALSGRHD